jgi:Holliday junction resolvase-like predicted endonuclease
VVIDPDLDGSTGELDLISRDGSGTVTSESKAGWTGQGSAGVLKTGSDASQTWGGAEDTNPDDYLTSDEPSS